MISQHCWTVLSTSVSVENSQLCCHEKGFLRLSLIKTQVLKDATVSCVEISLDNSDTGLLIRCNSSSVEEQGDGLNGIFAWLFLVPQIHLVTSDPLVEVNTH